MPAQRKIGQKRSTFSIFGWLDTFLVSWKSRCVVVTILTLIFSIGHTVSDIPQSFLLAVYIVWLYISCRKYGLVDTVEFMIILPLSVIFELMNLIPATQAVRNISYEQFSEEAKIWVNSAVNDIYEGKIVETRIEDGRIYILVETPYGLHIPNEEMIASISEQLHISPKHIEHHSLTDARNYYVFGKEAIDDYEYHHREAARFKSFKEIRERLLCESPAQSKSSRLLPQAQKIV